MLKLNTFICKIICLIGFIYQTYKISSIYFTYETSTHVRYETELLVSLPAITLCMRKTMALKDNIFIDLNSKNITAENRLDNMTIKEQFTMMKTPDELLGQECQLYKPIGVNMSRDVVHCSNITE